MTDKKILFVSGGILAVVLLYFGLKKPAMAAAVSATPSGTDTSVPVSTIIDTTTTSTTPPTFATEPGVDPGVSLPHVTDPVKQPPISITEHFPGAVLTPITPVAIVPDTTGQSAPVIVQVPGTVNNAADVFFSGVAPVVTPIAIAVAAPKSEAVNDHPVNTVHPVKLVSTFLPAE